MVNVNKCFDVVVTAASYSYAHVHAQAPSPLLELLATTDILHGVLAPLLEDNDIIAVSIVNKAAAAQQSRTRFTLKHAVHVAPPSESRFVVADFIWTEQSPPPLSPSILHLTIRSMANETLPTLPPALIKLTCVDPNHQDIFPDTVPPLPRRLPVGFLPVSLTHIDFGDDQIGQYDVLIDVGRLPQA